jgi:putative polyhydroxyalkanoate system protein
MPDIHIRRKHQLGLPKAREIATQWCEEVKNKFDMDCSTVKGEAGDTVSFKRVGASGTLRVAADHFELIAQLGFLLGAFSTTIEGEIERNLDDLLAQHKSSARKVAARKK